MLDYGTPFTMENTQIMQEYLINGGKLYIDCGTFFGIQVFYGYPNLQELMDLLGVAETEFTMTTNLINMLSGLPGSICHDLVFSGSTQNLNWFIDEMTPNENGIAAFEEEGYGTVAIQGEGEYGQKTFCFSYAIAKLMDGDEGTRDELMTRIAVYFDLITTGENEITSENSDLIFTIYPSPFSENTSLSYSIPDKSFVIIEIYNITGQYISTPVSEFQQEGKHEVIFNGTELSAGVYFCRLLVGEEVLTKKIVKVE